jgi:hypothetical protein
MVKRGFLRATSVGFRPKRDKYSWNEERGGIDFEEQELLEFSVVPVPSNPEALLSASKDFAAAGPESLAAFKQAGQCNDLSLKLRQEAIARIESGPGTPTSRARDAARHKRALAELEERRDEILRAIAALERALSDQASARRAH